MPRYAQEKGSHRLIVVHNHNAIAHLIGRGAAPTPNHETECPPVIMYLATSPALRRAFYAVMALLAPPREQANIARHQR